MTTITVPSLDPPGVTEERLPLLTAGQLREVLKAMAIYPPQRARKTELVEFARNGLKLQAMSEQPALPAPEPEPGVLLEEVAARGAMPSLTKWQQIIGMSEFLAKSNLTPEALRGKPHDVGAVLLRAHDLGIPLTAGLDQLYVIHGKVGMEAKLMRALVRRDGHSIQDDPASNDYEAIVHGRRADNGDVGVGYFTLDDALDQGLILGFDLDEEGKVKAVRVDKAKPQWRKDTATMLKWRATGRLCRDLFSDCLAGVAYTPDELGYIDAEEEGGARSGRAGEDEPTITITAQRNALAERLGALDDDLRNGLREEWKRRNLPKLDQLTAGGIRTITNMLEPLEVQQAARDEAKTADIDEAELVEDSPEESAADFAGAPAAPSGEVDGRVFCMGCGEALAEGQDVVHSLDGKWHAECAPT